MPEEGTHLNAVAHNEDVLKALLQEDRFCDWAAVVAFYEALHGVEAAFSNQPAIRHGRNHENREKQLKKSSAFREIYPRYRKLAAAASVARYLEPASSPRPGSSPFSTFADYMDASRVRDDLVGRWLRELLDQLRPLLSPKGRGFIEELLSGRLH